MAKIKIGMASFAHGHAFSYLTALLRSPDAEVTGIWDPDTSRVLKVVEQNNIPYYADYNEMLAGDIDAVIICSENVYHAQLTVEAAKAGKHVLCEKPLGLSVDEMKTMIETCREHHVQLMTAFPCRYLAGVKAAKAALERGDIGEVVAIKGTNRGTAPGGWFVDQSLSGGGAILDHTVHVVDLMNWFLDSEAIEVYAEKVQINQGLDIDDAGMVHIRYKNEVVAVLDPSWSRTASFPTWGDVTMEIIGTNGIIRVDGFAQKNEVYSDKAGKGSWSYWGDDMDASMIAEFVTALKTGNRVPINGQDGLKSAKVALAAYESIKINKPFSI